MTAQGLVTAEVMARLTRVVIVGAGGAGKSTILKQVLARAAGAGSVPVWVSLAALPADGPLTVSTLIDHLVEQAQARLGLGAVNRAFFETLVNDGKLVIGFDALDECGSLARRQKVRSLIVEVAREWQRCRVFVTSRPEALRETPLPLIVADRPPQHHEFLCLEPIPFAREDIAPFLRAAFEDGEALAQKLLGRTGIEALLDTPLTLTLVGLVARTSKGLPATRTPLFARCLDTVCETWEDAKSALPAADGLDRAQRVDVLRRLGWEAQRTGGDTLPARAARAALAGVADHASPARAKSVVDGLARRNLLLRAQTAGDGGLDVQSIRFSHPQFREYLAGAHLADQFATDAQAAVALMGPHWFDTGWLDVLRFAVATLENEPALRDALLRAAHAAEDPYRDLLHRPDFLVARLLARLPAADAGIAGAVGARLEQVAINEPALRDDAARALLALSQHPPALAPIERFARGDGAARAFSEDPDDGNPDLLRLEPLRWRLHAIEAFGAARRNAAALGLLAALRPAGLPTTLEICKSRVRLGDAGAARVELKRLFDGADEVDRARIAAAMDEVGEGGLFDAWLTALLDAETPTVKRAQLARERGLLPDTAPQWTRMFERATAELMTIDPDDLAHQPSVEAWAVVEAAIGLVDGARLETGRALLQASLHHRLLVWRAGPHVLKVLRAHAAEAVTCLKDFVIKGLRLPFGMWLDGSSLVAAVQALCDEADDTLAVPALLELLPQFNSNQYNWPYGVVESLRRRGRADDAMAILQQAIQLPPSVDDRRQDRAAARRGVAWQLIARLDRARTHALLDASYRSGDPAIDARRLMHVWHASGIGHVARDWFEAIAAGDPPDERARAFLHTLTTHERDTAFTDFARHALYGGVFASDDDAPVRNEEPVTAATFEREFVAALEGARVRANNQRIAQLLAASDPVVQESALRLADEWIRRALADDTLVPAKRAGELVDRLRLLSQSGLRDPRWRESAATLARALDPAQRHAIIEWLRENA